MALGHASSGVHQSGVNSSRSGGHRVALVPSPESALDEGVFVTAASHAIFSNAALVPYWLAVQAALARSEPQAV
jgi:hypothetical protein